MIPGKGDTAGIEGKSTLSLLNFENVRTGGIIETASSYTMLVEIEPREWLTLSEERRSNLYIAYLTYLRGLQFPTQLFTLTTAFDASQYCEKFEGSLVSAVPSPADASPSPGEYGDEAPPEQPTVASDGGLTQSPDVLTESPLLEYGRLAHAEWMTQILSLGDVRDRRFFVAVGVKKGTEESDQPSRLTAWRAKLPFGRRGVEHVQNEDVYLDEVWARAQRVASQLPRTQVGTTILDSREAVLDVLYQYYRGQESPVAFETATITKPQEDVLKNPQTGATHDFESLFATADSEAAATESAVIPPRPEQSARPFQGHVQDAYVERVAGSRLLQWYVQYISPIGVGPKYTSPQSVYVGVGLFLLSLLCGLGAFTAFLATGQGAMIPDSYWILRELALVLAAVSVPLFLLSLTILLPGSKLIRYLGLFGLLVTCLAIALFADAYPFAWDTANLSRTRTVLAVYGFGILVLLLGVAGALRARRGLQDAVATGLHADAGDTPGTPGGVAPPGDE